MILLRNIEPAEQNVFLKKKRVINISKRKVAIRGMIITNVKPA